MALALFLRKTPKELVQLINRDTKMIIPIRCFSCGKVIADLWERYLHLIEKEGMADGYV